MQCHTSHWLLHRSILRHTCFSCSGSICSVWLQKVLPLSASWLPSICHWQVVFQNQWQLVKLVKPCVPAYTQPTDAGLGEGVIGKHLQLVEGNACPLWCSQKDGLAVHLEYHRSHSCHRVSCPCFPHVVQRISFIQWILNEAFPFRYRESIMWLVLPHFAGARLHPLLSFLTIQTFSRRDIISINNKVDAVTLVWEDSNELPQVLSVQFMEGAALKILVMLNERHNTHYITLVKGRVWLKQGGWATCPFMAKHFLPSCLPLSPEQSTSSARMHSPPHRPLWLWKPWTLISLALLRRLKV